MMSTKSEKKSTTVRHSKGARKWSADVHTDSTRPPEGLFDRDAQTIARTLASKQTSPKGPASGMRMLTFYINRAGKNLSSTRLKELYKAKKFLHSRVEAARTDERSPRARKSPKAKSA